jgi:YidC/Oxa1 family membrane protein insertase
MMRGISYFLPAVSLAFTWWLPASVQLSFFITGVTGFLQAQLFRNASFRRYFNITPMPTRPSTLDAFAESPSASATSKTSTGGIYEPPREAPAKTTFLSGLTREVKSGVKAVQTSARKTMKSAKELAGQDAPEGKRSKNQLKKAADYEKKRRAEESRRREEMDMERRARREEKRRMREGR